MSLPVGNIVANGGKSGDGSNSARNGGAGTIYLKAAARQNGDLILDNAGIGTGSTTTVPGTAYASVAVKGGAKIAMTGSFSTEEELVLTGSSLNVSGALTLPGNLTLSNSTLSVGGALALPGDLTLNGSTLTVSGSLTAAGQIVLQNQSTLTHASATTSAASRLEIKTTALTIDSTSKIDVSGRGYLGAYQGGNNSTNGRTLNNATWQCLQQRRQLRWGRSHLQLGW